MPYGRGIYMFSSRASGVHLHGIRLLCRSLIEVVIGPSISGTTSIWDLHQRPLQVGSGLEFHLVRSISIQHLPLAIQFLLRI
jgi:hypothetical protein